MVGFSRVRGTCILGGGGGARGGGGEGPWAGCLGVCGPLALPLSQPVPVRDESDGWGHSPFLKGIHSFLLLTVLWGQVPGAATPPPGGQEKPRAWQDQPRREPGPQLSCPKPPSLCQPCGLPCGHVQGTLAREGCGVCSGEGLGPTTASAGHTMDVEAKGQAPSLRWHSSGPQGRSRCSSPRGPPG